MTFVFHGFSKFLSLYQFYFQFLLIKPLVLFVCRFSRAQVEELDRNKQWSRALDGSDYLPGMVILSPLAQFLSLSKFVS